jgi:hypothetical protein
MTGQKKDATGPGMYRPICAVEFGGIAWETIPDAQAIRLPRSLHFVPEMWSGLNQRPADTINKPL